MMRDTDDRTGCSVKSGFIRKLRSRRGSTTYIEYFLAALAMASAAIYFYDHSHQDVHDVFQAEYDKQLLSIQGKF